MKTRLMRVAEMPPADLRMVLSLTAEERRDALVEVARAKASRTALAALAELMKTSAPGVPTQR